MIDFGQFAYLSVVVGTMITGGEITPQTAC